ncbi:MAG: phospho-N-acetylmuramoyl-pentapeptide-transferase [Verrucomicrobiota bacterium]|jgi:phospho-N-acetylmuramoyl-pentapeptide-transferase|nr:phospho-N-acetylmuramoyl-pentapeptide-transferase [Verrucomicrobiota bacterium]
MLVYLSKLTEYFSALNIFGYVTFRAFMGAGTAFVLSLLFGRWMIARLCRRRLGQVVRSGKEMEAIGHGRKSGTPTMGGLLIIFTCLASSVLWCNPANPQVWLVAATMLFMGGVGLWDDVLKLRKKDSKGLGEKQKLALQALWVGLAFLWIQAVPGTREHVRELMVPFFKNPLVAHMSVAGALVFMWLVITGTTNAVNITDGLDGLAIGCTASVVGAYLVLAYVAGNAVLASYLLVPSISGSHELAVFCGCLLGSCLGFLWWNAYPAKVFMGDTGSLALGGTLAMVAILIKQELTLIIVGFVFVVEMASVILQRNWFRYTRLRYGEGRRLFRMAPFHHHVEIISKEQARAEGRSADSAENSVVIRFWIVSLVCALLGLATLKLR